MAASPVPEAAPAPACIILVTANKGGTGKTTTSINIAVAAAYEGRSVCAIDFDPQRNLTDWGKQRTKNAAECPPIVVIPAALDDYRSAVANASEQYDVVVIDTPPGVQESAVAITGLTRMASIVIVPTGLGWMQLKSVVPYAKTLREVKGVRPTFLLNNIDSRRARSELADVTDSLRKIGKASGTPIPLASEMERCTTEGKSLLDVTGRSRFEPGCEAIRNLWSYVKQEVELV